ncbi:hypothetical protein ACLESD_17690 [Pyxidicoccus sp. 3LFB2]
MDVIYTAKRRISPVYLLDAVAETALLAGWGVAQVRSRARRDATPRRLGLRLIHDPVPPAEVSTLEPARH